MLCPRLQDEVLILPCQILFCWLHCHLLFMLLFSVLMKVSVSIHSCVSCLTSSLVWTFLIRVLTLQKKTHLFGLQIILKIPARRFFGHFNTMHALSTRLLTFYILILLSKLQKDNDCGQKIIPSWGVRWQENANRN